MHIKLYADHHPSSDNHSLHDDNDSLFLLYDSLFKWFYTSPDLQICICISNLQMLFSMRVFLFEMMNTLMYPFVTEPLHLGYSIINFASGGSHFTFYNLTILCSVHSIIVLPSNGNLLYNSINLASYNATKSNFDVLKRFNRWLWILCYT